MTAIRVIDEYADVDLDPLVAAPEVAEGRIYFDTVAKKPKVYIV
jgi:hypothetical protein